MKKLFVVLVALAFTLSCAAIAIAAEEKAPADAKAAASKPDEAKKEAPRKAKAQFVTGTIEAIDPAAGTLTVKGKKKGPVDLKAGEKVKLEDLRKGDKVTVKYSDGTALSVTKAKKAEPRKDGETKKGGAPAAPAAPAAPPAEKK